MGRNGYHPKYVGTMDAIVDEKMKVLEELCVIDDRENPTIRAKLVNAIKQHPESDMQVVVDRIAKTMIFEKFNKD